MISILRYARAFCAAIMATVWAAPYLCGQELHWMPDTVLTRGYEMAYVSQPDDYSGPVRSTIIRRLAADAGGWGVLYVHGFNDYFLQWEMGEEFNARSYDFYAVDLRKYGRSIIDGQKMFEMRSIDEYYADIDSALSVMRRSGVKDIVVMGHSTGGLVVSCYLNDMDHNDPEAVADVRALVLNSPFLDWNLGKMELAVPLVSWFGGIAPGIKVSNGGPAYSESLLASHHGEWDYNTDWKLYGSSDVDLGWVRGIHRAQQSLRDGRACITQPVLLLYSARSVEGDEWTPEHNKADAVLDVDDIRKYGAALGPHVTRMRVEGGLHDLLLSAPGVRQAVYSTIFKWLDGIRNR